MGDRSLSHSPADATVTEASRRNGDRKTSGPRPDLKTAIRSRRIPLLFRDFPANDCVLADGSVPSRADRKPSNLTIVYRCRSAPWLPEGGGYNGRVRPHE
jgi:hypothetical protein